MGREKLSLVFWVPSPSPALFLGKKGWLMLGQGPLDVDAKEVGLWDRARQEDGHTGI